MSVRAPAHSPSDPEGSADAVAVVGLKDVAPSDEELVSRAKRGDRWAMEVLVRRHIKPVAAMVTRMLGDPDIADEIVQDTFVVALACLHQVRDSGAVRSWLLTIAARRVRRRYRRDRMLQMIGLLPKADAFDFGQVTTSSASPEQRAELSLLARSLEKRPASHRVAWMLRRVEGYSLVETAELCGCSLATVKRWIRSVDRHVDVRLQRRPDDE